MDSAMETGEQRDQGGTRPPWTMEGPRGPSRRPRSLQASLDQGGRRDGGHTESRGTMEAAGSPAAQSHGGRGTAAYCGSSAPGGPRAGHGGTVTAIRAGAGHVCTVFGVVARVGQGETRAKLALVASGLDQGDEGGEGDRITTHDLSHSFPKDKGLSPSLSLSPSNIYIHIYIHTYIYMYIYIWCAGSRVEQQRMVASTCGGPVVRVESGDSEPTGRARHTACGMRAERGTRPAV